MYYYRLILVIALNEFALLVCCRTEYQLGSETADVLTQHIELCTVQKGKIKIILSHLRID